MDTFYSKPVCVVIAPICKKLTPWQVSFNSSDVPFSYSHVARKGELMEKIIDCDPPVIEMTLLTPVFYFSSYLT